MSSTTRNGRQCGWLCVVRSVIVGISNVSDSRVSMMRYVCGLISDKAAA